MAWFFLLHTLTCTPPFSSADAGSHCHTSLVSYAVAPFLGLPSLLLLLVQGLNPIAFLCCLCRSWPHCLPLLLVQVLTLIASQPAHWDLRPPVAQAAPSHHCPTTASEQHCMSAGLLHCGPPDGGSMQAASKLGQHHEESHAATCSKQAAPEPEQHQESVAATGSSRQAMAADDEQQQEKQRVDEQATCRHGPCRVAQWDAPQNPPAAVDWPKCCGNSLHKLHECAVGFMLVSCDKCGMLLAHKHF